MKKILFLAIFLSLSFFTTNSVFALTEAECTANGSGATCNYSQFGGNGCDDEGWVSDANFEKDLGVCSGSGATSHCCVPYATLCKKQNGTVKALKASRNSSCGSNESISLSWGNSVCCTSKNNTTSATTASASAATASTACATPDRCDAKCAAGETSVNKTCVAKGQVCCSKSTTGAATGTTTGTGTTATGSETAPPQPPVSISFENPLKYNTVEGVLTSVMGGIQSLVATIALLMIVIGAIMYVLSFGDEGKIKKAKTLITAALIGIVIVIAAPAFLKEIANLLGWGGEVTGVEGATSFSLTQIATKVLQFLLSIIGTLALIMLIIGAIMYLTSAGNENQAKKARSVITAAFIGIVIAMASLVVIGQLAEFFK